MPTNNSQYGFSSSVVTGLNTPNPTPIQAQPTQQNGLLSDDEKSKITSLIQQYRGKYSDDQILNGLINDNKETHPEVAQKIQSWLGSPLDGSLRTDRNNNPIAAAVKTGSTNDFTKALDNAGVKWTYGDAFPGDPTMSTIKILGDPLQGAKAILSSTSSIDSWYANHTGKSVLSQYGIKSASDFANSSPDVQKAIVEGIYNSENGTQGRQIPSGYDPKTILDGILNDNKVTTSQTQQDDSSDNQVVDDSPLHQLAVATGFSKDSYAPIPNPIDIFKGMAEPILKGGATAIRTLQATPEVFSGQTDKANQIMSTPVLGQPTLVGSSNAQNIGSAVNAASLALGLKETLPSITSNKILNATAQGTFQGALSGEGQYLASSDRPSLKTTEGQIGALKAAGSGALSGAATGAGAAAVEPVITGQRPNLNLKQTIGQEYNNQNAQEWSNVVNKPSYQKSTEIYNSAKSQGVDLGQVLANNKLNLQNYVEEGRFSTSDLADKLRTDAGKASQDMLRPAIKKADLTTPKTAVGDLMTEALNNVINNKMLSVETRNTLLNKLAETETALNGEFKNGMSLENLLDEKIQRDYNSKYNPVGDTGTTQEALKNKAIADAARKLLEQKTPSDIPIKEFNAELSKQYKAADYLDSLNNKKVPVSMGAKVREGIGKIIGAKAGTLLGGGVLGGIAGYHIGGVAEGMLENMSSPMRGYFLKNLQISNPAAFTQIQNYLNSQPLPVIPPILGTP